MALRDYPNRLLSAAVLSSFLLAVVCGTVAALLAREQSRTADVLEENIRSRTAAANLEDIFAALAVLHQEGTKDPIPLHEQAEDQLAEIERFADKDEEQELARQIVESYRKYVTLQESSRTRPGSKEEVVRYLQAETLPACRLLKDFNVSQIDRSERTHRESLRQMTWGLAVVGVLGSLAGLVLGYGLARSLRRTIQQFMIQVQGVADLLGPASTRVEWQRDGWQLQDGAELLSRVEEAVVRLQERERDVRRAERLAAMGQLAAGVAHEIRNPLTSALLLFQMARKDPSAGGLTEEDLNLIEQELQRIDRSLQTFLDFARPPQLSHTACDLVEVVRDALAVTRGRLDQQGVTADLDAPVAGCRLDADPDQLRQVVLNLLLNALDAMPHGGRIKVTVRTASNDDVELSVVDTGTGIPEPILARLFEPFVTGKETGLGLGLVVSKRIIDDHQGTIRGSNHPAGGASFVVRLPVGTPGTA